MSRLDVEASRARRKDPRVGRHIHGEEVRPLQNTRLHFQSVFPACASSSVLSAARRVADPCKLPASIRTIIVRH
jgi:hypothetical protein